MENTINGLEHGFDEMQKKRKKREGWSKIIKSQFMILAKRQMIVLVEVEMVEGLGGSNIP